MKGRLKNIFMKINKKGKIIVLIFTVLYLIFFIYGIIQLKEIYNKFSYGIIVSIMIAMFIAIFIYYLYFMYLILENKD